MEIRETMNKQREIKFRFYDKTDKRMKYFDSIWNMPDPSYDFDDIQQFTGLLDKNGKEIFEGDIVKIAGHTDNDVVIFKDGAFCIEGWTNTLAELMTDWSSNVDPELIEVIGNVHENPELLKEIKLKL